MQRFRSIYDTQDIDTLIMKYLFLCKSKSPLIGHKTNYTFRRPKTIPGLKIRGYAGV